MGAAELARTLRLRTPTMIHHLHALRLAGLIQIRMTEADKKGKAFFSLRPQAVRDVMSALDGFLHKTDSGDVTEAKRQTVSTRTVLQREVSDGLSTHDTKRGSA